MEKRKLRIETAGWSNEKIFGGGKTVFGENWNSDPTEMMMVMLVDVDLFLVGCSLCLVPMILEPDLDLCWTKIDH